MQDPPAGTEALSTSNFISVVRCTKPFHDAIRTHNFTGDAHYIPIPGMPQVVFIESSAAAQRPWHQQAARSCNTKQ